jgi:hypothetical protein
MEVCQSLESLHRDIGGKQWCPLSPTHFGLYINRLEKWIDEKQGME